MKKRYKIWLLSGWLVCGMLRATAQDEGADTTSVRITTQMAVPSEADWNSLTRDKRFNYAHEREGSRQLLQKRGSNGWLSRLIASVIAFTSSFWGRWLLRIVILAFVLYFIYRVITPELRFSRRRRVKDQLTDDDFKEPGNTEDLENGQWEERMMKSAGEGNYRDATRFAYLAVLKLLARKEYIVFRVEATDFHYYRELSEPHLRELFGQLLLKYQYAWFGRATLTEVQWQEVYQLFHQMISALR